MKLKVWVTKTLKFRVRISEVGKFPYEVTVGGNNWSLGVGCKYRKPIMKKISRILKKLNKVIKGKNEIRNRYL